MKIRILSDLHLEHSPLSVTTGEEDVIVLAGDIANGAAGVRWAINTFPRTPVVYVPGNHEFYGGRCEDVLADLRSATSGSQVHVLDRDPVIIGSVRFLGATLWTDFRFHEPSANGEAWAKADALKYVPDFDGRITCTSGDVTPDITQAWHYAAVAWLAARLAEPFPGRTIVVSHHAPSAQSICPADRGRKWAPTYASHLDSLVQKADLWIHGHVHESSDYLIGSTRVICNPRGIGGDATTGNPRFAENQIIDLTGDSNEN